MRMLGIDFGDARVGFATCDESQLIATGLRTECVRGMRDAAKKSADIAAAEGVQKIIVGLPINMNGEYGVRTERTFAFVEMLKEYTDIEIDTIDERLTTVEAYGYMHQGGMNRKKKKKMIDTLSAEIILQSYIDEHK